MKLLDTHELEERLFSLTEQLKETKDSEKYLEILTDISAVITFLYRNIEGNS